MTLGYGLLGILAGLALVAWYYIRVFNALQHDRTRVEQGWSGIEVQLMRRHDLIPGLVAAVRAAMAHETALFDSLTEARTKAVQALASGDAGQIAGREAELGTQLRGLLLQIEDTPEISATGNVQTFQRQLEETEDQIAAARRLYNGNVQALNARIAGFPGNLVAPRHDIRPAQPFTLEPDAAQKVHRGPDTHL